MGPFPFANKIITTGEGGAILTNQKDIYLRCLEMRDHGMSIKKRYFHKMLGFNYRMSDIHAALGLSQLSRLNAYVDKRQKIASIYDKEFLDTCVQIPLRNPDNKSALHLYIIQVEKEEHNKLFHTLREKNIFVNLHYIPVHTQPFYQKLGFKWGDFPNSEEYYQRAISLPIFPSLKDAEQNYVIETLKDQCCAWV